MMRYLAVLAASVAVVVAQLTINTPQGVLACTNQQINWAGGAGPYILQVQPGGDTSAAAIETFTGIAGSPYTWHVIEQANTQVFLRLHDNNGLIAESATFTIQSAGGAVCSGTTGATAAATTTPAGAATTPAGGASTTPAAPATTPATTPAAGGATTPAGGATTAPAGSSTTHASSSTTTTHNGASALQVAGGLVGLVGAVAVALA